MERNGHACPENPVEESVANCFTIEVPEIDPIGVKRLLARPIATLCIEAKRRQEKQETGYAG